MSSRNDIKPRLRISRSGVRISQGAPFLPSYQQLTDSDLELSTAHRPDPHLAPHLCHNCCRSLHPAAIRFIKSGERTYLRALQHAGRDPDAHSASYGVASGNGAKPRFAALGKAVQLERAPARSSRTVLSPIQPSVPGAFTLHQREGSTQPTRVAAPSSWRKRIAFRALQSPTTIPFTPNNKPPSICASVFRPCVASAKLAPDRSTSRTVTLSAIAAAGWTPGSMASQCRQSRRRRYGR